MRLFSVKVVSFFATAVFASGIASANIIPTYSGVTTVSAGVYLYSYTVILDSAQQAPSGSRLCFSDIQGLLATGVSSTAAGWTGTANTGSGCPINSGVAQPNAAGSVLFTYSGSLIAGSNQTLGTFSFESNRAVPTVSSVSFGATAQKQGGSSNGTASANQGEVTGPGGPTSTTTPEPASMALLGTGLLLFAKFGDRFRNRKA